MKNEGVSALTDPDTAAGGHEKHVWDREKRRQKLQQATMEILTNLAETDNLPWAVQVSLLNIISTTGVQAGAIRLSDGEDYVFTAQEKNNDFEKNTSLDCSFGGNLKLYSTSDQGEILPCMFNKELMDSGGFFCTNISRWYKVNAACFPNYSFRCEKCWKFSYETTVMVPIKTAGEILGLIHLYDDNESAVSSEEVAFLETISGPLGYALKHLQDRESIRRSEEQFRFLAENARDIIFRMQIFPEKKYIYVSPASTFIIGYSPEEYYADEMLDKKLIYPADYPLYKSNISSDAGFKKPIILRLIHKNGHVIWVEFHLAPIYNKDRVEIIEGIARDITGRVRAEQELKTSYEQLKTFSSMILNAQEEERIRLSRELHDEVGQALTAVKIDLQVIKEDFKRKGLGFQERLSESVRLVDLTLERVRKQAVSLRPPALDHMGLVAAVQNMAQGFSRRTGIGAKIIAEDEIVRFSKEIEIALFRCVQESLTNIARHSGAKKVAIEFKYLPDRVQVSIKDDGKGFEPDVLDPSSGRLGLVGMRERVKLLNGNLIIESKPHRGTHIAIMIPLTCSDTRNTFSKQ